MSASAYPQPGRVPWLLRLLGWMLRPWLAIRREPAAPAELLQGGVAVCYVVERYGLSNALILEQACREAGLPSPLKLMPGPLAGQQRSMLALSRRRGFLSGRSHTRAHSESLTRLFNAIAADPAFDVQLIPVSIFVGRAPDRQSGWFRVLFSENWAMAGRLRRLLAVLLNGRNTIVQFAPAVSLRATLAEGMPPERALRKTARVLRAHFRRVRAMVIGPDLSHRRMLIDTVLSSERVQAAIADQVRRGSDTLQQVHAKARQYAWEIAADYSNPVVRSASFLLAPFWNKLYDGIQVHHFDTIRQAAPGHEVIYVPCHRSHIDYLLLSYLLYQNGLVPPHIAAGVNLNLPLIGPLLRRGGAFYLRRSFKANPLYSTVFSEYVTTLINQGVAIEYFIEGGRSRTGRLLPPKGGMLTITLRAFLRQPRRPIMFQPVYIGYEKLMEARSYLAELSGQPKKKESLFGLLRAFGLLRHRYGKVSVNFGAPIFLEQVLTEHAPGWRDQAGLKEEKPAWFGAAVDDLSRRILREINRAADVNPIGLLALALLSTPKQAMAERDLLAQLDISKQLLARVPYSERVTVTALTPSEIIAYGERMEALTRIPHPLGDVLSFRGEAAVLQGYYRNNVVHLFAAASWVACCFQINRRMSRAGVVRLGRLLYPFIRNELFLPWNDEEFGERLQATVVALCDLKLLRFDPEAGMLSRGPGQTDEVFQLRVIAHSLLQAFERYYIAILLLVKNGPKTLSIGELENGCRLTAQRLSLLYAQAAPEFFDRGLFRSFITQLRESNIVWLDEAGKLDFDERLNGWANDAKLIVGRELRHSILKITPGPGPSPAPHSALPSDLPAAAPTAE